MTVKELKKLLEQFDENLEVLGADHEYYFYSFEKAEVKKILYGEEDKDGDEVVALF